MPRWTLAVAVALLFVGAAGCPPGGSEASDKPDGVVVVSIEALRADRLEAYGGDEALPAFARVAKDGVVFEDAVSVAPQARPAAAALLTGIGPDRLAVRDDISDRLPEGRATLATAARDAKARTAAFVSTPFCSFASGFQRGFDLFDGPEEASVGPVALDPPQRPAAEVVGNAVSWIDSLAPGTSFLAWVHLGTLHGHSVGESEEKASGEYADALREVDAALGRLLDALDKRKEPVDLVVLGTHGTHLGENGKRGAAFWLGPETLKIPLLWQGAGLEGGRRNGPAWIPDVPATVAARLGWALPAAEGADLFGATPASRERRAWSWAPDDQLAWPTLSAVEREGKWVEDASRPATPRVRVLSEETRAALAERGLAPQPPGGERAPVDEVTRTDVLVRLQRVRSHIARNRPLMAMKQGRRFLEEHSNNLGALLPWVYMAIVGGDPARAEEAERRLLTEFSDRGEALHAAAHVRWQADRGRAEQLLRAAWELGPRDPEILYDLACARSLDGDAAGAIAHLKEAIDRGYRDWRHLEGDLELANARKSPEYAELMRARGR